MIPPKYFFYPSWSWWKVTLGQKNPHYCKPFAVVFPSDNLKRREEPSLILIRDSTVVQNGDKDTLPSVTNHA